MQRGPVAATSLPPWKLSSLTPDPFWPISRKMYLLGVEEGIRSEEQEHSVGIILGKLGWVLEGEDVVDKGHIYAISVLCQWASQ